MFLLLLLYYIFFNKSFRIAFESSSRVFFFHRRTNRERSGKRRRKTVRHVVDAGEKRHGHRVERRLRGGHSERVGNIGNDQGPMSIVLRQRRTAEADAATGLVRAQLRNGRFASNNINFFVLYEIRHRL